MLSPLGSEPRETQRLTSPLEPWPRGTQELISPLEERIQIQDLIFPLEAGTKGNRGLGVPLEANQRTSIQRQNLVGMGDPDFVEFGAQKSKEVLTLIGAGHRKKLSGVLSSRLAGWRGQGELVQLGGQLGELWNEEDVQYLSDLNERLTAFSL